MRKFWLIVFAAACGLESMSAAGDDPHLGMLVVGAALPSICKVDDLFYKTAATAGLYTCTSADTWTAQLSGSGGPLAGSIILIVTGTCPWILATNTIMVTRDAVGGTPGVLIR